VRNSEYLNVNAAMRSSFGDELRQRTLQCDGSVSFNNCVRNSEECYGGDDQMQLKTLLQPNFTLKLFPRVLPLTLASHTQFISYDGHKEVTALSTKRSRDGSVDVPPGWTAGFDSRQGQENFLYSRDSPVGVATGYGLDDRGVEIRVPVETRIFSPPNRPDWLWGPPTSYVMGTGGSFLGGKAAGA
jgi:hypothetical protein